MDFKFKNRYGVEDLLQIVKILRSPEGCPWDKVQTHESIRKDFIEEVFEAVEAIDDKDIGHLREELGDVLFQVVFHSQIETEQGHFDFYDAVDEVSKKMILRHPHVFGEVKVDSTEQVWSNWDAIKMESHAQKKVSETMEDISKTLPSLMKAQKLVKRAGRGGVVYSGEDYCKAIEEKTKAFAEAARSEDKAQQSKILGELLFSVAGLAQTAGADCEISLYDACNSFQRQFRMYEEAAEAEGIDIQDPDAKAADRLWAKCLNNKILEES